MRSYLFGPLANDVSHKLLLKVLCTIGVAADKWQDIARPLFFSRFLDFGAVLERIDDFKVCNEENSSYDFNLTFNFLLFFIYLFLMLF